MAGSSILLKANHFLLAAMQILSADTIENLKQCAYLKFSYLKMGSHGNALAVNFFSCCARLRSYAYNFHHSIEKRCGKLGCYISFNEIHVLYRNVSEKQLSYMLTTRTISFRALSSISTSPSKKY